MYIAYIRSSNLYDDSRATKEISALLEDGHTVAAFGWNRIGNALEKCEDIFSDSSGKISFSFYSGIPGKKFINKVHARYKWNKWLTNELSKNNNIQIIHSCDYDTGVVARKIAKKKHIKYVYDIFDYYVDAHPVPSIIKGVVEKGETKVINDSATTIICTEERVEQIRMAKPAKLVIIHNSPDVSEHKCLCNKYDYVYCGGLNGGRLIKEILEKYPDNNSFKFVVAGTGMFSELASKLGSVENNFLYLGAVSYSEVLAVESESAVISAIYDPSNRNHRLCAPNKFYEALALGKPVIVCRGTGIDKIVAENNIGVVIGYDADEFYHALEYLKITKASVLRWVLEQESFMKKNTRGQL